jgi:hypothetical protein
MNHFANLMFLLYKMPNPGKQEFGHPNAHEYPDLPWPLAILVFFAFSAIIYLLAKNYKRQLKISNQRPDNVFPKRKTWLEIAFPKKDQ